MTPEQQLFALCQQFITRMNIQCPETIYQTDRVIENAYEFIEEICNVVGYVASEDEEE